MARYLMISRTVLLCMFVISCAAAASWDPYDVLGVKTSSSTQDIRKAYKQLAKEWHPDKNNDEGAEAKFVEINKAYELLSDPARRKLYDQKGVVEQNLNTPSPDSGEQFGEMPTFFTQNGGFRFKFKMPELGFFYQQTITLRAYMNNILPQSDKQPYLILVYSEWCMPCVNVLPLWQRLVEEVEPVGVTMATVHYDQEPELAHKLGGRRGELPHIVLVLDSRVSYYNDDQLSVIKVIEFIRNRFKRNLMTAVTDANADEMLTGWKDNKVRVLLFGKLDLVRLRYLVLAFRYRPHAVFGYVHLNQDDTAKLAERYGVPNNLESLLLFHEDSSRPVARLSMAELPFSTMKDVIYANKYLQLPRLSSQPMLDSLCPAETAYVRRRLCAILVTEDRAEDDEVRHQLRQFTRQFKYSRERVTFTYIFKDKQNEFLSALTKDGVSPAEPQSYVVIVWRQDTHRLSYSWLAQPFVRGNDHWNTSKTLLQSSLVKLLATSHPLPYQTVVKELVDEHALGIVARIYSRLASGAEFLREHVTQQELLTVASIIATILFIVAVGYVMAYFVRLEEEAIQKQRQESGKDACSTTAASSSASRSTTTELKLHELRSETYNGMVRLLKPGCRTVVLLVDNSSKASLIPVFHKAVWPYRKNKSLMFGWMNVDRGLKWYSRLLTMAMKNMDEEEEDAEPVCTEVKIVKAKNCVGTVISLNGHRRYFCIYHAMHPENYSSNGGQQRMQRMARRLASSTQTINGSGGEFMGFEDSEESSEDSEIDLEKGDVKKPLDKKPLLPTDGPSKPLLVDTMLDNFTNWLDRLFEGSTHRYYINYWPEFGNY